MLLYYESSVSGGDFNQDFGDPNNFWQDSSHTIPNGALPTSSDNVIIDDQINTMSSNVDLNNLSNGTQSSFTPNGNQTLTVHGVVTLIVFENFGNVTVTGPGSVLHVVNCNFQGEMNSGTINATSGTQYNSNLTDNIIDDGTGLFGGSNTFSGSITFNGNLSTSATLSGIVTATEISGGNFSGNTIHCNTIVGGNFNSCTINQTGNVTIQPGFGTNTFNLNWSAITSILGITTSGGTNVSFVPTYTPIQYVLTGIASGSGNGQLIVPITGNVKSGIVYGVGGNGSTGTLSFGAVGYAG